MYTFIQEVNEEPPPKSKPHKEYETLVSPFDDDMTRENSYLHL